jgi:hypothetical protein
MHTVCPICKEPVDTDRGFSDHLAVVHGLVDDAGTQTTLDQAMPMERIETAPGAEDEIATERPAAVEAGDPGEPGAPADRAWDDDRLPENRVYDPDADSERYRKVSLGVAGLLLIAATAYLVGQQEAAAPAPTAAGPSTSAALISDAAVATTSAPPVETTTIPTSPPVVPSTTAPPPPVEAVRAMSATVVTCTQQGDVVTLRFGYQLQGAAQPDGRYEEMRIGQSANGPVVVSAIRVNDRLGRQLDVPLEPAPLTCG